MQLRVQFLERRDAQVVPEAPVVRVEVERVAIAPASGVELARGAFRILTGEMDGVVTQGERQQQTAAAGRAEPNVCQLMALDGDHLLSGLTALVRHSCRRLKAEVAMVVPAVTAATVVPEAGVMERIASPSRAPRTGPSGASVADAVIGRVVVGSVLAASESRGRELSARVRA